MQLEAEQATLHEQLQSAKAELTTATLRNAALEAGASSAERLQQQVAVLERENKARVLCLAACV